MGRVTDKGFAAAWPSMTDEAGFADRMNRFPKYIVSTTLEKGEWNNSTIIKENVTEEVARLKKQPGRNILIYGSGQLAYTLLEHNLLDEYRIWLHPVVRGQGRRLFGEGTKANLELLETKAFSSGVVAHSYRPAETGSP